jgi:hypothetical protein
MMRRAPARSLVIAVKALANSSGLRASNAWAWIFNDRATLPAALIKTS